MFTHASYLDLFSVALCCLFSHASAAGWTLDNSCSGEMGVKVRESMNIVFDMAGNAADQLNRNPINEDVMSVYRYLFQDTEDVRDRMVKGKSFSLSIERGIVLFITNSIDLRSIPSCQWNEE
jgi:hypothetical protein